MDHYMLYALAPQGRFGLQFFMSPIDFRSTRLFVDGHRVKQLLVVSLAAERFWRLAFHERHGLNGLTWNDVPTIQVRNVVIVAGVGVATRKRKLDAVEVELKREDSMLALRVARDVARLLEKRDYRILDAVVPQLNKDKDRVGEHDLVCEQPLPATAAR